MRWMITLMFLPGLVIGLTLHEFAHAWAASLLGDDFARRQGRVSLNPFRHLSPLGTLFLLFLPFGWGKPVPVNLYNFKNPRRDYLLTSLAGPTANLLVVAVCFGLMQFTRRSYLFGESGATCLSLTHYLLMMVLVINLMLAVVNLLPVPPLDGSKIWPCILPGVKPAGNINSLITIVFLVILMSSGAIDFLTKNVVGKAIHYLPKTDQIAFSDSLEEGFIAILKERWTAAETAFTKALAVNPRSDICLKQRAVARHWLGKWDDALKDIDAAIVLNPLPEYKTYREVLLKRDKPEKLPSLEDIEEDSSDQPDAEE